MAENIDKVNSGLSGKAKKKSGGGAAGAVLILLLLIMVVGGALIAFNVGDLRNMLGQMMIVTDPEQLTFEEWRLEQETLLMDQADALDQREKDLTKLESDLKGQKTALEQAQLEFESLKTQPESPLVQRAAYLAGIYELMDTASVAKILDAMESNAEIVRILQNMTDEKVADILSSMKKDRAAEVSRALMGLI